MASEYEIKRAIAHVLVNEEKQKYILYIVMLVVTLLSIAFKYLLAINIAILIILILLVKRKIEYLKKKYNVE